MAPAGHMLQIVDTIGSTEKDLEQEFSSAVSSVLSNDLGSSFALCLDAASNSDSTLSSLNQRSPSALNISWLTSPRNPDLCVIDWLYTNSG